VKLLANWLSGGQRAAADEIASLLALTRPKM
jgi:hypothetical protein